MGLMVMHCPDLEAAAGTRGDIVLPPRGPLSGESPPTGREASGSQTR